MKTLLLLGNQLDNLGDIILNKTLVDLFSKHGEVYIDDKYMTDDQASQMQISDNFRLSKRFDLPNPRKLKDLLGMIFTLKRPYDIISRYPGHCPRQTGVKAFIYGLRMAILFTLFRLRGYKIVQAGVTYSTSVLKGPYLWLERWQALMHDLYSVRDKKIAAELHDLGIMKTKYIPDIFLYNTPEKEPLLEEDVKARRVKQVVICVRPDLFLASDLMAMKATLKQRIIDFVVGLESDVKVVFAYQVEQDESFARELYQECKTNRTVQFIDDLLTPETAKRLYIESSLIVSNRQHCLLFGFMLGTPIIGCTDWLRHAKLRGAFNDLGLQSYMYDIKDPSEKLISMASDLLSSEWKYRKKLRDSALSYKRQVNTAFSEHFTN